MDNIWIWIIVGLLLWQGMRILQFFLLLYYKFEIPEYHFCKKDELDKEITELLEPYEKYLISQGFDYEYTLRYKNSIIGSDTIIHKLYYCNKTEGIQAFLETTPYKGSEQSVKLSFDTIYKSNKICTTENGIAHFVPATPSSIYFFDHYLASWKDTLKEHLKDRVIKNEEIGKGCFNKDGLLAYITYIDNLYIDEMVKKSVAIKKGKQYRYKPSFALWKFAKKMVKGQLKSAKILKDKKIESKIEDKSTYNSQKNALIMQIEQLFKPRGDSQNKKKWFLFSIAAFILFLSILGLSFVNILMLIVIIFIHELGHYLAMRYFGYLDTGIFFLPFGAVATGDKVKRSAFEEYIVLLMGPLPGIIIGIGIIMYQLMHYNMDTSNYLTIYALMSLIINYINLLPIYPLDGGKILQTLLLLRYPKAQFYFYIISLVILTISMLWLKDPMLLIFVVIIALGLKQSYLISELMQIILKKSREKRVDVDSIASILISNKKFLKESLSSKANIGKQALLMLEMVKPSKLLIIFGMGLYLTFLLPPIVIATFSANYIYNSPYKSTKEGKVELRKFNKVANRYLGLTKSDEANYTIKESIERLNSYLKIDSDSNLSFRIDQNSTILPCKLSNEHIKVLKWHNGLKDFIPYQNLLSYQELLDRYKNIKKENLYYEDDKDSKILNYILAIGDGESYGLAYKCNENGLFDYSPYGYDSSYKKEYYNWNHFLKVTLEAYKRGIYKNGKYPYIDEKRLANLKHSYYSSVDKKRYSILINYLKDKAQEYKTQKDTFLKSNLLGTIGDTYDTSLIDATKIYLKDKEEIIRKNAIYALGKVGDESVLPILISYSKSKNSNERNFALTSIAEIVNSKNRDILPSLYHILDDEDILVRLSLYEVIEKVKDPKSLYYLRKQFNKERDRGKLSIIDIFYKIGTKNELKLLKDYLKKVNKMDITQKNRGGFRGSTPHPKILKEHIEDAIKAIKNRENI